MAQNILCDLCEQEPGMLMQSNINNGDVITVGENCMLIFLLTTVSSILDEMPAENAAQFGEGLAPIVAKLAAGIDVAAFDEDPESGDMVPLIGAHEVEAEQPYEPTAIAPAPAAAARRRPGKGV
jgi:hypothetical protein